MVGAQVTAASPTLSTPAPSTAAPAPSANAIPADAIVAALTAALAPAVAAALATLVGATPSAAAPVSQTAVAPVPSVPLASPPVRAAAPVPTASRSPEGFVDGEPIVPAGDPPHGSVVDVDELVSRLASARRTGALTLPSDPKSAVAAALAGGLSEQMIEQGLDPIFAALAPSAARVPVLSSLLAHVAPSNPPAGASEIVDILILLRKVSLIFVEYDRLGAEAAVEAFDADRATALAALALVPFKLAAWIGGQFPALADDARFKLFLRDGDAADILARPQPAQRARRRRPQGRLPFRAFAPQQQQQQQQAGSSQGQLPPRRAATPPASRSRSVSRSPGPEGGRRGSVGKPAGGPARK